jgi:hypothetical protein
MISSFVYLCALIFEKTHLDLITYQKMHCLIFIFFKISFTLLKIVSQKNKIKFEIETIEVVVKKLLIHIE